MRTFRHWTPRYIFNRIVEKIYRRRNPNLPWLSPQANEFLQGWLKPSHTGLEFGSGRSTLWFARRVAALTSIEHNPEWYDRVSRMLKADRLANVNYQLHTKEEAAPDGQPAYVRAAQSIPANSLDFVLVDGIYREQCMLAALDKIRPGGILILDNVHLYLPGKSHSPNARGLTKGPASPAWAEVEAQLQNWRCDWSSNGVSDTAIYFKPS